MEHTLLQNCCIRSSTLAYYTEAATPEKCLPNIVKINIPHLMPTPAIIP